MLWFYRPCVTGRLQIGEFLMNGRVRTLEKRGLPKVTNHAVQKQSQLALDSP